MGFECSNSTLSADSNVNRVHWFGGLTTHSQHVYRIKMSRKRLSEMAKQVKQTLWPKLVSGTHMAEEKLTTEHWTLISTYPPYTC